MTAFASLDALPVGRLFEMTFDEAVAAIWTDQGFNLIGRSSTADDYDTVVFLLHRPADSTWMAWWLHPTRITQWHQHGLDQRYATLREDLHRRVYGTDPTALALALLDREIDHKASSGPYLRMVLRLLLDQPGVDADAVATLAALRPDTFPLDEVLDLPVAVVGWQPFARNAPISVEAGAAEQGIAAL